MNRKAVSHLRRVDPVLAEVIDRVGPCRYRVNGGGSHFDAITRAIVYQQLSGSAAATIHSRLIALYGGATPEPALLLAMPDELLRGAGLSRQKISYLRDLAVRVESGDVPLDSIHQMDDDAVIEALTRIKGVGRWTAQMFLMFRLGRPDILPELDLGVRKAIQLAYRTRGLPTTERVQKIGKRWAPYRTIASWYLWASIDMKLEKPVPRQSKPAGRAGRAARSK
jgi:3-methyladenine DNA glycosylase/8-oxoguanine DNA glycosylase